MSQTASNSFTYDNNLTPQISGMSPSTTTVIGELSIYLFDNSSVRWDHMSAWLMPFGIVKSRMEDGTH